MNYLSEIALGDINITMGLEEPSTLTLKLKVTDRQVNLLRHVDIAHSDVSVSQGVKIDNPDSEGQSLMSINSSNKLGMTSVGADVYGSVALTGKVTFTGTGTCSALVER